MTIPALNSEIPEEEIIELVHNYKKILCNAVRKEMFDNIQYLAETMNLDIQKDK